MRGHEVESFISALGIERRQMSAWDLIRGAPTRGVLGRVDVVLIGGSGDFSVVRGGPWLEPTLEVMRHLHDAGKPTFASCWGFQAVALALGGEVVHDPDRAEVGSVVLELTEAGCADPVFGPLGDRFPVLIGHEDRVKALPPEAVLLASSPMVENQAFCFPDRPLYATQFHPELNRDGIIKRIRQYGDTYLPLTGLSSMEEFEASLPEAHGAGTLMLRFVRQVL